MDKALINLPDSGSILDNTGFLARGLLVSEICMHDTLGILGLSKIKNLVKSGNSCIAYKPR